MLNEETLIDYFVINQDSLVIQEEVGPLIIHGVYSLRKMYCFPRSDLNQVTARPSDWKFACKWDGKILKTNLQCPPDCDPIVLKGAWFAIEDLNHRSAWFEKSVARKMYFDELERDCKWLRMATTVLLSGHDTGVPAYLKANTEDIPSTVPECAVQWACREVQGIKHSEQFDSMRRASA